MTDSNHDTDNDQASPSNMDDDWAAAMSEQAGATRQTTQADGLAQDTDDWASALAEQTAATQRSAPAASPAIPAQPATHVFQPLMDSAIEGNSDIDMIMDIPVQLRLSSGVRASPSRTSCSLDRGLSSNWTVWPASPWIFSSTAT